MLPDAIRNEKLGVFGPPIGAFGESDLFLPQRFAMGGGGINFMRRTIADVAIQDDQRRSALGLAEQRQRLLNALEVVGVTDPQHIPLIAEKTSRNVLSKSNACVALNGNVIIVID